MKSSIFFFKFLPIHLPSHSLLEQQHQSFPSHSLPLLRLSAQILSIWFLLWVLTPFFLVHLSLYSLKTSIALQIIKELIQTSLHLSFMFCRFDFIEFFKFHSIILTGVFGIYFVYYRNL